jgi:hypothetical protein
MTSAFTITPTVPTSIKIKASEEATFSFTVLSLAAPDSARDVMLRAQFASADGKDKEVDWLIVGPQPVVRLAGGQTQTVTITVRPTDATPRGENNIKLVVADKQRPNDIFEISAPVVCEIAADGKEPPPVKRIPWWLIAAIAGGVVVLLGGSVLAWKLLQKPKLGQKCEIDSGCADDLVCVPDALTCLRPPGAACTAAEAGLCASGECSASSQCAVPTGGTCNPDDATAPPCARHGRCDATSRTCMPAACTPGAQQCRADGAGFDFCTNQGTWTTVACPSNTPRCRDGRCQAVENAGTPCGSCGGTIQGDGSCSVPTPPTLGQSCGSCGGKVQCDGSCSVRDPGNLNQPCGSCGGKVQCDGSCSVRDPGNLNQPCGHCGGKFLCNGSCSQPDPPNFGGVCNTCGGKVQCNGSCSPLEPSNLGGACNACGGKVQCNGSCSPPEPPNFRGACNACGGTVQCNGSCSPLEPPNFRGPCGQCGGTVQCNGSCSIATPPNLGALQLHSSATEQFTCCFINYTKTFGGTCHAGWAYERTSIDRMSGGGGCEIVSEGHGNDCRVTVRFHNNGTDGAQCKVSVFEKRVCN